MACLYDIIQNGLAQFLGETSLFHVLGSVIQSVSKGVVVMHCRYRVSLKFVDPGFSLFV